MQGYQERELEIGFGVTLGAQHAKESRDLTLGVSGPPPKERYFTYTTRTPKGPLVESLWPFIVGTWGVIEGSWGCWKICVSVYLVLSKSNLTQIYSICLFMQYTEAPRLKGVAL